MELFFQVKLCGALLKPIGWVPKSLEVGVRVGSPPLLVRLKRLNSSSFSCGVIAPGEHSVGNNLPGEEMIGSSTWYSLNNTRPHWFAVAPTGVSKVNCMTGLPLAGSFKVSQDCVGAMMPLRSCLTVKIGIWPCVVEAPTSCSHCASVCPSGKLVSTVAIPSGRDSDGGTVQLATPEKGGF